ncbi:MAG TPA: hypothetical protein VKZ96_13095, partial [Thermomicrobiales bacterium]|nr:hypothetical protein [Thermomicrobiales bacterium]
MDTRLGAAESMARVPNPELMPDEAQEGEAVADRNLVMSVVELATSQGPLSLDEILKFVDPDTDPATFDLLEAELSSRGLIITPEDEDDTED